MCSWSIVVCLLTFSVLAIPGSQACSCVGVQPFCNALPQRDAKDQVIFVGTVTDSYPKSWAHYAELTQRYLAQSAPGAQVKLGSDIQSLRQAYFGVFGSTLSPDEKAEIGRARTEDELEQALGDLRFSPRRVRLHVRESFVGSRTDEFEVFTGLGGGDCGVGFHEGETWLVVARRSEKTERWITS